MLADMIRTLIAIIGIMVMFVSCQTNAVEEQKIELKNQLIGLTSAHNARQLGGYQIGNQRIKDNLLLRSAKISGLSEEDSTLQRRAFQEETSTISVTKTRAESTE